MRTKKLIEDLNYCMDVLGEITEEKEAIVRMLEECYVELAILKSLNEGGE